MQFNRFKYTTWLFKLGLWNHKRLASKWSKFPFEQQVGIKLAAWGSHSPELDIQPGPAVQCWEVLPVPLTLLGWCFLLILPLALPAGTALSPGICHILALPRNGLGDFAVCELLPVFPSPGLYYICDLWAAADVLSKRTGGLSVCQGNDICSPLICKISCPEKCPVLQLKFSICKFLLALLSLLLPWGSRAWQLMFCCFDVLNNVFCQPSNAILFLWRHQMLQLENLTTSSLYCVEWSAFTFGWPPLAQQHYSPRHQKGNECPSAPSCFFFPVSVTCTRLLMFEFHRWCWHQWR